MMDKVPDPLVKLDNKNLCNNLYKNLRSKLCSNLCNNLRKNLTSFRRFSVEDFKISVVPKVATEVATSVIQTGSSYGWYCER
jgi:hypothetical protein